MSNAYKLNTTVISPELHVSFSEGCDKEHYRHIQAFSALYRNERIEVRLVKRRDYNEDTVRWADAVISAGGMTLWKGNICFSTFS